LLSETLEQMQQQQSQMSAGEGQASCPRPGMGQKSISSMRQLQQQLNKQMEDMKKGMQKGKDGKMPMSGGSMSEQLARMAAQQEAIRNQMQKYLEDLEGEGVKVDGGTKQILQDMERTETDLVNKMISNQTLMRQKEILTRLLKSEEAERIREQENKRESKEAKNQKFSNPEQFFEYKSNKQKQVELLRSIPPSLRPFYKKKVNEYLYNFED